MAGPPTLAGAGRQSAAAPQLPRDVKLSAADVTRLADEARQGVKVELPPNFELKLWAPDALIVDPVALEFDEKGTIYATSTSRNNMPLDIREHPTWVPPVHTLKTVADLREFYQKELAPERSAKNQWLPDLNRDGSNDIRDLAMLKERLYRIQDTDGDGVADTSKIMIEGFNVDPTYDVAGGLLYNQGDLLIGIAPGVWRLKDDNGDGTIDRQIVISEGYSIHPAFGGHGISGLTMGPDGRIYWEVGDIGLDVTDKSGKRWSYPNQGAVMRSEPDGSNFEVFATGIRNLQEFSFDEYGNLISVDNDGDHQGETERVVYIPNGSDSGWRSNWQYGKYTDTKNNRYNVWMDENMFKPRFAGQAAHIIPPVAAYHAGPSGMVYNPGTALTDEWRNYFFVSSFPGFAGGARIYGFKLKQDGAGFALEDDKVLLRGILTVGMKFGPDGALYLTDWITGWDSKNKGRIWKLDSPAAAANPMRAEVRTLIAANFGTRPVTDLSTLLRHADMRIRQKAQFELVRRGDVKSLLAAAKDPANQLARIHGIWGVAQLARTAKGGTQHAPLLVPFLTDADAEIRGQAAKMLGDLQFAQAAAKLVPLLADSAPRARFFAAEALGRIAYKPATAQIVAMLAANDDADVYLRHAGSLALSRIGDAAALGALSSNPSRGVRIAAIIALRRLRSPEVGRFVTDADDAIVLEAARAINDDGGIDGGLPALAQGTRREAFYCRTATSPSYQRKPESRNDRGDRAARDVCRRLGAAAGNAGRGDCRPGRLGGSVADGSRRRDLSGPGEVAGHGRPGRPGRYFSTHAGAGVRERARPQDRTGRGGRKAGRRDGEADPPHSTGARHVLQRSCGVAQSPPGVDGVGDAGDHESRGRRQQRRGQAGRAWHLAVADDERRSEGAESRRGHSRRHRHRSAGGLRGARDAEERRSRKGACVVLRRGRCRHGRQSVAGRAARSGGRDAGERVSGTDSEARRVPHLEVR